MTPTQAQIIFRLRQWRSNPFPETHLREIFDTMDEAAAALTAAAEGEPQTSVEYHQRRGAAWDIIDQAICSYDQFMLDDDYDAQDTLDKIIAKMRERRSLYHAGQP